MMLIMRILKTILLNIKDWCQSRAPPLQSSLIGKIMDIIVMKSGAYRQLMDKIEAIEQYIRTERARKPAGDEIWLDSDAVCAWLRISRRTLQRYRSNGTLRYSLIGNKTHYRASEVWRLFEQGLVKPEYRTEVCAGE